MGRLVPAWASPLERSLEGSATGSWHMHPMLAFRTKHRQNVLRRKTNSHSCPATPHAHANCCPTGKQPFTAAYPSPSSSTIASVAKRNRSPLNSTRAAKSPASCSSPASPSSSRRISNNRGGIIRKKLQQRAAHRRRRRTQNPRHRPPCFGNRTRKPNWLPPSLQSRVDNVVSWARRLQHLTRSQASPLSSTAVPNPFAEPHCIPHTENGRPMQRLPSQP
jgi:hypothetical protein